MGRRARKSTWRKAAAEAGGPGDLSPTVLIGLGLIFPMFLVGAGFWAIELESVAVPSGGVSAPVSDSATGSGDRELTGSVADGFGIALIGLGLILHGHLAIRRFPFMQWMTVPFTITGFLMLVGGVTYAISGSP